MTRILKPLKFPHILRPLKEIIFYFLVVFFVLCMVVLFTQFPNWLAVPLSVEPRLEKADAIVILSGGSYSNGVLALFTHERLVYGITLYNQGFARKIILVGRSNQNGESDADFMAKVAQDLRVPREAIIIEGNSFDTYANIRETAKTMEENNFKSALLVTSPIHMRRSLLVAKKMGVNFLPAPPLSADQFRSDPADRLVLFYSELWEFLATIIYWTRGWI